MTLDDVRRQLETISCLDDESAHSLEDRLYTDFVKFVAKRNDKIGMIARKVLESKRIKFARWCA